MQIFKQLRDVKYFHKKLRNKCFARVLNTPLNASSNTPSMLAHIRVVFETPTNIYNGKYF